MTRVATLVLAAFTLCTVFTALAGEIVLPPPGGDGWRPLTLPKVKRHSTYTPVDEGGIAAVRAESRCSASALTYPLEGLDLTRTPRLRWRWRVERGLSIAGERVKTGDDFAARVYVLFRFQPERASFFERARNRLGRALYGREIPGNVLNYVWTSAQEPGAAWRNPFASVSLMISLGRGPLPSWRDEDVDVAADYRAHFGHDAPPVLGLALMSDSDNSCQEAVAYFADFRFLSAKDAE